MDAHTERMRNIMYWSVRGQRRLKMPCLIRLVRILWEGHVRSDLYQMSQGQHSVTCLQPYLAKMEAWRNGAEV